MVFLQSHVFIAACSLSCFVLLTVMLSVSSESKSGMAVSMENGILGFCKSELDCSLNGDCLHYRCKCDRGWRGANCGILDIKPAIPYRNGYWNATFASWGGSVITNYTGLPLQIDSRYHMHAALIANECGLNEWGSNSLIAHLTSESLLGPYELVAEIVPPFAHNPQTVLGPDGFFYLFYIGGDGSTPKDCRSIPMVISKTDPITSTSLPSSSPMSTVSYMKSHSLAGPWERHSAEIRIPDSWNGFVPAWLNGNSNPSPLFNDDGSVFLAVVSGYNPDSKFPLGHNEQVAVAHASSVAGPYYWVSKDAAIGGKIFRAEDPFIWKNKRGFHILAHALNAYTLNGGRLAYSKDGYSWYATETTPYTLFVENEGGLPTVYERRERPKLVLGDDGNPVQISTGVRGFGSSMADDITHTLICRVG